MTKKRQVVITGIGVISPGGVGRDNFWDFIASGKTATALNTVFDPTPYRAKICAQVDFDPAQHGFSDDDVRRLDRAAQFGLAAADEAVEQAGGLGGFDLTRVGVSLGSAVGATVALEREFRVVSNDGEHPSEPTKAVPELNDYLTPASFATEIATRFGVGGPVYVASTGCTSGIDAVGYGAESILEGAADVMLAGATDAPISPITVSCFDAITATTPQVENPETASRPFDNTRQGFVLGEGAAMFVLEEYEHAKARGATILGAVRGYATRSNAFHMTGLRPDGKEMSEAIIASLSQAGLAPTDIHYVNAHGSGTRQNDIHETGAVKAVLGEHAYKTPMTSIKSMVGHSLGAIGSIEIAACALAIQNSFVPPTANLNEPDPECDLDYVPRVGRAADLTNVLTVGSGFGGFQSALIVSAGVEEQ